MKAILINSAGTGRWFRVSWVGLMTITIVIIACLQIISASSHCSAYETRASEPKPALATGGTQRALGDAFARLPLRFEACASRTPARYVARTGESTVYILATEANLSLRSSSGAGRLGCGADLGLPRNARSPQANEQLPEPRRDRAAPRPLSTTVRMQLLGANRDARVAGEQQLKTRTNYLIGKDATQWRTEVPNYARVKVEQVYRGIDIVYCIDIVYYGSGQQELEYDFKVAPGADYKAIRLCCAMPTGS